MVDSAVQTVPDRALQGGDHDRFAHYVSREDHLRGYFDGEVIEALCGKRWVPTADAARFPLCPTCKEVAAHIGASTS